MRMRTHHEAIYRGADAVARLAALRVTLCGAGAVGSHLADNLVRQGLTALRVLDRDKVEGHNVGTQLYGDGDVGAKKADVLKSRLFRTCGVEIDAVAKDLTDRTADKLLAGAGLVIDTFDNSASRRLVQDASRKLGLPCLHVGLNADYAEVLWDEGYRVPNDVGTNVCDYPLARNLVLLAVAVASEVVVRFAADGTRENWTVTLRDFAVRPAG
jgi:molybdopterin/thiamine biosynthesis adenylyltransferase